MTAIEIYALGILYAVRRGQLRRFRFGIGKVEQIVNLVIGASLCLSGLWVAQRMVATLLAGGASASPLDMAIAAVVNAVNLLGWVAMLVAARSDDSLIYVAQGRARGVKLACSVLLQSALTIAALARDPVVAIGLDAAGAVFVSGLMLVLGWRMSAQCAPDLLDHALEGEDMKRLLQALAGPIARGDELLRVRTRRCGGRVQTELVLAVPAGRSCVEIKRQVPP